ncbi:hypothetical protein O4214_30430 [Rhodococcus erythropolis]|uniref:hypothetical protein n=1 Tax=Rhodococcus erythropolis TaxID=1833 RepID=UPI001E5BE442|nr:MULTISPECIES: hypothetical protein [Rhodococcus erythropolis group]MCD2109382.1 hypothetical protein [Rhodococcus qingshengii]MCZ4528307.1 hypothetical protein [Rhodococcus erythropolis]
MTNTKRHPAVIELLGGAPMPASAVTTTTVSSPTPQKPPKRPRKRDSRSPRLRYVAALIVVVALLGWFTLRLLSSNDERTQERIADETDTSETAPTLDVTPPALASAPTTETDATACRTDPGDQKSGPGVIAAFEHAYYVTRSGTAVRALTTPDSSLPAKEKIQAGIDTVPTGTTHCVRITPIAAGIYSVALTEMRPGQPPAQFPQTITAKELDGRWFVDVIN